MEHIIGDLSLAQIRVTERYFKKGITLDHVIELLESFVSSDHPFLMVFELNKVQEPHYHFITYLDPESESDYREQVRTLVSVKDGYILKWYNNEKAMEHKPEWYFGYLLKTGFDAIRTGRELHEGWFQECLDHYNLKSKKVSCDMLLHVQQNYEGPYDPLKLLLIIQDYYISNKKVYDKNIILRRAFHLARGHLFEQEAIKDIKHNYLNIING